MASRRVLYDEARVRQLFAGMRAELQDMHARHVAELDVLRRELDSVHVAFDELRAACLARSKQELDLEELRRLREIGRARATVRDPALPLN